MRKGLPGALEIKSPESEMDYMSKGYPGELRLGGRHLWRV